MICSKVGRAFGSWLPQRTMSDRIVGGTMGGRYACACEPGWTGEDCSLRACDESCGDAGWCYNGTCTCYPGSEVEGGCSRAAASRKLSLECSLKCVSGCAGLCASKAPPKPSPKRSSSSSSAMLPAVVDEKVATQMIQTFTAGGFDELDTALMYGAVGGGTEKILGTIKKEWQGLFALLPMSN